MTKSNSFSRQDEGARNRLLAEIGRDHFLAGKSKVQVAAERGLSRFQVATLLQEALAQGVVRITIHTPEDQADRALSTSLGVHRVVTVGPGASHSAAQGDSLARAVADVVDGAVSSDDTVGVSWSRTLQKVVGYLQPMPTCELVQLAGAVSTESDTEGPRLLAGVEARAVWPLWAPLVVDDATSLRSSAEISRTLEKADDLDVAVIAVGSWKKGFSTVWDRVPRRVQRAAVDAGAVAEISGRLLDADGAMVSSPVDDMVVAATLDQMARARHTIAVAYGAGRAPAVLAAVRAGIINTLVCDLDLHEALAELLGIESLNSSDFAGGSEP
ncbi:Cro/Cl family transcriptional regulator [Nesterenkonia sp. YGD6]|uniref:sugar-binding transcriptional regulator n=1 Tax=Nesterenkonia sp. YGD6 TaxID=2901231 RepID=UPI001F4CA6B0|nr:sugar-binding domain-containing protein [Nesterenkonia sp. YGD6]MCH8563702.1 Cro/Cl family transcriptional regulator [Nesterenkonia sp. YGD6]